ncbi:MAG: hypothetical protein CMB73_02835 [Euryarchaeota archaeon]|nr:hypothetical protein [Euryarchaeota archaeon]|tara:strand:+ start:3818 stop:6100 length:2283 start_codon:yes stop_codon:yes gene_type:complete
MDIITIGLGLGLCGGLGASIWAAKNLQNELTKMQESGAVEHSENILKLSNLNSEMLNIRQEVSDLNELLGALKATNPELSSAIDAHQVLSSIKIEDYKENYARLLEIIDGLCIGINPTSDNHEIELSEVKKSLLNTILSNLKEAEISFSHLNPNPELAKKLGFFALAKSDLELATSCFGIAYRVLSGDDSVLLGLEKIAILEGNVQSRRQWMEARIQLDPDNPELLRSHAHLLAQIGDDAAKKDIKRLEALGVDTAADRSLLSGLMARAGESNEALEKIEQALAQDPSRGQDWYSHAEILFELGEPRRALDSVERSIELQRQDGPSWALKAKLLTVLNAPIKDSLRAATHAVALEGGGTDLILLKSHLLEASGSTNAAEESLLKAIADNPMNGELRARVADQYLMSRRLGEVEQLLAETPTNCDHILLHVVEGRLLLAKADRVRDGTGESDEQLLQDALQAFNTAIEMDRESGLAWLGVARAKRLLKDTDGSSESLRRASRLLEDTDSSVAGEQALLALESGDLVAASQAIDLADINGETPLISYVRGNIAARRGEFEKALVHFEETLTMDPGHIRARLNRCSVNLLLENSPKALDDAEILLEIAPNLLLAKLRRAEANMALASWSNAVEDLKEIIDTVPNHYHALTQLASCHMALERPERAEGLLNEALRINPEHAEAWHQRGLMYLDWKNEDAALSDFESTIRCRADHMDARLHIAALHHEGGRFEQAATAWMAVLAIDPDHEAARVRLSECESAIRA